MKKHIILLLLVVIVSKLSAQDIDDLMNSELSNEINYTSATFKSTRIINSHSVEQLKKQHLDFRISHRFGTVNNGISDFFGIDKSSIRLSLEYGITDWLMTGIGRSSFNQTYEGFIKVKILQQSTGEKNMPVSVNYFACVNEYTSDFVNTDLENYYSSRFSYIHQILIARKFNENLSLQLTPTLVHRNLVETVLETNDLYAIGIGGRYKLSRRIALTTEYFYSIRSSRSGSDYNDPFSIGVDIETGGHVFQLMLTNTSVMHESGFISGENNDNFFNGDIHFGFNITRIFSLKK
ncbi:MAG: outer membrane beta-barrel protein [Bacteroidales bacterium]|nr:outer membrane beta-barrel protein [Bacteroidales bacterium]